MRLIDADAWIEEHCEGCKYKENGICSKEDQVCGAVELMNEAPTIDAAPVVHAQWKPYYDYFTKRQVGWICSNCSGVQDDVSNGDTTFCPECGAIMED